MLNPRSFALLGTSAVLGLTTVRGFQAHASTNRVYTSIRQEWEFNQLLSLPNPLLANFCILTDPKSKMVSDALQALVNSGDTEIPVSSVDVEVDEPGNKELMQRYIVAKIPTILALQGGIPVERLEPTGDGPGQIQEEIKEWIKKLK